MDSEDTNNTTSGVACSIAEYRGAVVHFSFPFAVCIILILSHVQRTKKERRPGHSRNPCRGVFSLIYPLDLFDNHDRLPYCLAFGAASSMVLDLIFGDYQSYFFGVEIPAWSKILVGSIVTVEIAIDCFPFFACITCKSRLLANGMGFLYLTGWFGLLILISVSCEKNIPQGAGQIPVIVPQIPVLACTLLLALYFLVMFITILIQRYKGIKLTSQERLYKTHQAIYVRNLLNKPQEVVYTGWRAKLVKYYKPNPGFIYPTRVLMACFVSVVALYQAVFTAAIDLIFSIWIDVKMSAFWVIPTGRNILEMVFGAVTNIVMGTLNSTEDVDDILGKIEQAYTGLTISWLIASGLSIIMPLMYIPSILSSYREHTLSMWSGKCQLPSDVKLRSQDHVVGSLKYIGFQVAVFLAGYMFIQVVLFIFIAALTFVILAFIWDFQTFFIEIFLELAIPSTIVGLPVMLCQPLFVRYVFMQDKLNPDDKDRPLALQHTVWFQIFSYVTMFLNTLFGLILAVFRIIIGIVIALLLVPRIDRSIWPPGSDGQDLIYVVYAGNLYTENAHSNPILVMFCHLLVFDILKPKRKRQKLKRTSKQLSKQSLVTNSQGADYSDLENAVEDKEPPRLLKYFRWHLAYTLLKNPSLIKLRKRSAIIPEQEVVISDGQAKFVEPGKGDGRHQLLPHIVQVMKRQDQRKANSGMSPSASDPSINAVDPGLIHLENPSEYPEPSPSANPANLMPPTNATVSLSVLQPGPSSGPQSQPQPGLRPKGLFSAGSESIA